MGPFTEERNELENLTQWNGAQASRLLILWHRMSSIYYNSQTTIDVLYLLNCPYANTNVYHK